MPAGFYERKPENNKAHSKRMKKWAKKVGREHFVRMSLIGSKVPRSEEAKKNIRKAGKKKWLDEVYREIITKAVIESNRKRGTRCANCGVSQSNRYTIIGRPICRSCLTNALYEGQNGLCAICSFDLSETSQDRIRTALDHSHRNGKVRGLLCSRCNCGIGQFKDSVDLLIKAAEYLLYHKRNDLQVKQLKKREA